MKAVVGALERLGVDLAPSGEVAVAGSVSGASGTGDGSKR